VPLTDLAGRDEGGVMKKGGVVALCLLLNLILVMCAGCEGTETGISTTPSTPEVTVSNEPHAWMALDSTKLQQGDMDKATEMCERLIRDSYMAKKDPSSVDLTRYITDSNLLKYSERKLKEEAHHNRVISRVDVSVVKADYHDTYLFLKLASVVYNDISGHSSEAMDFLVKNEDGRLVVADWGAMGAPNGISPFDFMHRRQLPVANPTIWEDPAKVKVLFVDVGIQ
jgi:hypothetical protein